MPAHAAWLDQAQLLVGTSGRRYLERASWRSRNEFLDQVNARLAGV